MRARAKLKSGQAIIEYMFLVILIATVMIAVLVLAGKQVEIAFNDVRTDVEVAVSGGTSYPQLASPHTCSNGDAAVLRHEKWRCDDE